MNIKNIAAAALLVAGMSATPAYAQFGGPDTGFYIGGSIGQADYDIDSGPVRAAGATAFSSDDSDTGWKIYAGYQFHKNFGAEVGYYDFGSLGFSGAVGAVPFGGSIDVTAWTIALVATLPVHQNFDLFGKVGAYNWKSKGGAVVGGTAVTGNTDGTDAFVGIGARYNFSKNFGVQVEAEHFTGDDTINLYSIGLRFKF